MPEVPGRAVAEDLLRTRRRGWVAVFVASDAARLASALPGKLHRWSGTGFVAWLAGGARRWGAAQAAHFQVFAVGPPLEELIRRIDFFIATHPLSDE